MSGAFQERQEWQVELNIQNCAKRRISSVISCLQVGMMLPPHGALTWSETFKRLHQTIDITMYKLIYFNKNTSMNKIDVTARYQKGLSDFCWCFPPRHGNTPSSCVQPFSMEQKDVKSAPVKHIITSSECSNTYNVVSNPSLLETEEVDGRELVV